MPRSNFGNLLAELTTRGVARTSFAIDQLRNQLKIIDDRGRRNAKSMTLDSHVMSADTLVVALNVTEVNHVIDRLMVPGDSKGRPETCIDKY